MVQSGLQQLTGKSSWGDIWYELFKRVNPSGYQAGQKIAIKVNFNNSGSNGGCSATGNLIDALPHPVKALIASLKQAGVQEQDIWIYDATKGETDDGGRYIPDRFRNPILSSYPSVVFYGKTECTGVEPATFNHVHPSLEVEFLDPDNRLPNRWLPDQLYQATYLINIPIVKQHGIHPVSLGFKNHFGSLSRIHSYMHDYISPSNPMYETDYSPLVDIYRNPNIKDKTVLTLGDGLYGAAGATNPARQTWNIFGDALNSLFFSTDPVAVDCVMADFVVAEGLASTANTYDYLFCAQEAGFGTCEGTRASPGGDPLQTPYGSGYSTIQYIRV